MLRTFPDGVFPSVALDAGRGWMAVREGDPRVPGWLVVYEWTGTDLEHAREIRRWGLQAGSPAFPALHILDGLLWLAYHDGTQLVLRNVSSGAAQTFPALSNPVAFGGQFFAYCEPSAPYQVHRINLVSGEVTSPRLGAPTGLSRVDWRGEVVTIDEDRLALPGTTIPSFAGDLAVGEGPQGGAVWVSFPDADLEQRGTLWAPLDSFTPKCAEDGARLAITTAGSGSVRLFCGTLADLIAASAVPVQPPVPPVQPPSVPPQPEPPSMSVPNQLSAVQSVRARYPTPLGAQHPAFLIDVAKTTGAKLLRKDSGTHITLPTGVNVSQDILMFGDQGIDILGDAEGAATPAWTEKGTIPGEYIDVSGTIATTPDTGQPAPSGGAGAALDAQIAALSSQLLAVSSQLSALSARVDAQPSSSGPAPSLNGARVAIRAWTGKYFRVEPDGSLSVTSDSVNGAYETQVLEVVE